MPKARDRLTPTFANIAQKPCQMGQMSQMSPLEAGAWDYQEPDWNRAFQGSISMACSRTGSPSFSARQSKCG